MQQSSRRFNTASIKKDQEISHLRIQTAQLNRQLQYLQSQLREKDEGLRVKEVQLAEATGSIKATLADFQQRCDELEATVAFLRPENERLTTENELLRAQRDAKAKSLVMCERKMLELIVGRRHMQQQRSSSSARIAGIDDTDANKQQQHSVPSIATLRSSSETKLNNLAQQSVLSPKTRLNLYRVTSSTLAENKDVSSTVRLPRPPSGVVKHVVASPAITARSHYSTLSIHGKGLELQQIPSVNPKIFPDESLGSGRMPATNDVSSVSNMDILRIFKEVKQENERLKTHIRLLQLATPLSSVQQPISVEKIQRRRSSTTTSGGSSIATAPPIDGKCRSLNGGLSSSPNKEAQLRTCETTIADLEKRLQTTENEKQDLNAKIEQLETQLQTSATEQRLANEISRLKTDSEELETKAQELETELDAERFQSTKLESEVRFLRSELKDARELCEKSMETNGSLNKDNEHLKLQLKDAFESLQKLQDEKQQQLEDAVASRARLEAELSASTGSLQTSETERQRLSETTRLLEQRLADCQKEMSEKWYRIEEERTDLKQSLKAHELDIEAYQKIINAKDRERDILLAQYVAMAEEQKNQAAHGVNMETQLSDLKIELGASSSELLRTQRELEVVKSERIRFLEEQKQLQEQLQRLKSATDQLNISVEQSESFKDSLYSDLAATRKSYQDIKADNDRLEFELLQKVQELERAKASLIELRATVQVLQERLSAEQFSAARSTTVAAAANNGEKSRITDELISSNSGSNQSPSSVIQRLANNSQRNHTTTAEDKFDFMLYFPSKPASTAVNGDLQEILSVEWTSTFAKDYNSSQSPLKPKTNNFFSDN